MYGLPAIQSFNLPFVSNAADQRGQPGGESRDRFLLVCRRPALRVQLRPKSASPRRPAATRWSANRFRRRGITSPGWASAMLRACKPVGDVAQDHVGPLGATAAINGGEPSSRCASHAKARTPVECRARPMLRPDAIAATSFRRNSARPAGSSLDRPLAAAEMVKD